jgi:hypothetical protein
MFEDRTTEGIGVPNSFDRRRIDVAHSRVHRRSGLQDSGVEAAGGAAERLLSGLLKAALARHAALPGGEERLQANWKHKAASFARSRISREVFSRRMPPARWPVAEDIGKSTVPRKLGTIILPL